MKKENTLDFFKLQRRDRDEFNKAVDYHNPSVKKYFQNRLDGNIAESENLSQETWIVIWKRVQDIDFPHRLESYLLGMHDQELEAHICEECDRRFRTYIYNVCNKVLFNFLRKENRRKKLYDKLQMEAEHEALFDPSEYIPVSEKIKRLRYYLPKLPKRQREVIFLFYYQELTVLEIAKELNISDGYVRTLLCIARKNLGDNLL